jgi:hypothetical protein
VRRPLRFVGLAIALTAIAGPASGQTSSSASEPQPPAAAASSPAPAPKWHVTAGSEWMATNAYIWRGFVPNDSFSVQPNNWIKFGDVTVTSWMNIARRHVEGRPITEHDLTVDYSKARGAFTWSAGWINYTFPELEEGRYSNEVYVGLAHASYLNPSVRVYQDVHEGTGTYLNVAISHAYPLMRQDVSLTPSVALGYNHHQWIDVSTFSDLNIGLRLTLPTPVRRLSVAPFVNHSRSLDSSVIDSRTYGGLVLAVH